MKFTVTEVLVSYIKDIRKEQKISVTEFANRIGKSKSYITKFDNCEFKTLTLEDFKIIFDAISYDLKSAEELMDDYFLLILKNDYAQQNPDLGIDLSNYSNIVKQIDIRPNLIDRMKRMFEVRKISLNEVVEFANKNEPVKKYSNYDQAEFNEYTLVPIQANNNKDTIRDNSEVENDKARVYIKIKLDNTFIEKIFNKEIEKCNYFTLLAIAHAFYRLDISKSELDVTEEEKNIIAIISARSLLFNFQTYALGDYYKLEDTKKEIQNMNDNLLLVSYTIQSTMASYINLVAQIYKQSPFYIEDKIKKLRTNLEADAGFCVATLDLPLYKIKNLNIETKKRLLRELSETIERYASDEEYQEQIELI